MGITFFLQNLFLGVGLAMDAFSVSVADGLNEPTMKKSKIIGISGTFGIFQFLMSFIGWVCVSYLAKSFAIFAHHVPKIAFFLLLIIGGKMIYEGIKNKDEEKIEQLGFFALMLQGVATSIDALSVGFTISEYSLSQSLIATLIIGIVTALICFIGVIVGKKFKTVFSDKANIVGGIILIAIGLKILIPTLIKK
ncbi:MAG: manganese efflux pump MntP family protein [Clostridia bacterium]|nr:manganese efflux pump MntP family protein [Clostridia bacterium]